MSCCYTPRLDIWRPRSGLPLQRTPPERHRPTGQRTRPSHLTSRSSPLPTRITSASLRTTNVFVSACSTRTHAHDACAIATRYRLGLCVTRARMRQRPRVGSTHALDAMDIIDPPHESAIGLVYDTCRDASGRRCLYDTRSVCSAAVRAIVGSHPNDLSRLPVVRLIQPSTPPVKSESFLSSTHDGTDPSTHRRHLG